MNEFLKITPIKYGGETLVISMRLPKTMLAEIDKIALQTGRSRNDILMQSLEFALDNIIVDEKEK